MARCKDFEIRTLTNLLDNYAPLSLSIYSVLFKAGSFPEYLKATKQIWIMFWSFRRHHYNKADARQLWDALEAIDWDSILQGSLEEAVLGWTDSFMATCHTHVPHKLITINPSSKPWYNKHLKSLATWRDRLFRRSRGQPHDATVLSAFRKVRNLYVLELRAVEKRYFSRLGWKLSSGSLPAKVWWRYAKKACGWSSRTGIQTLSVDGQVVTSPNQQAAMLNEKFIKQCSAFPPSSDSTTAGAKSVFEFQEITSEEVFRELKGLPGGKSPGLDGVSNRDDLLKIAACRLLPNLLLSCLTCR